MASSTAEFWRATRSANWIFPKIYGSPHLPSFVRTCATSGDKLNSTWPAKPQILPF